MHKALRLTLIAMVFVLMLPAGIANAATTYYCTPWNGHNGIKVRTCLTMTPVKTKHVERVTATLQVRNGTQTTKNVRGTVTVGRNGVASDHTGTTVTPAGTRRTVARIVRDYPIRSGRLYATGVMTKPFRWGTYTATRTY